MTDAALLSQRASQISASVIPAMADGQKSQGDVLLKTEHRTALEGGGVPFQVVKGR